MLGLFYNVFAAVTFGLVLLSLVQMARSAR